MLVNASNHIHPRRIAFVHDNSGFGGLEIFVLLLIKHLDPKRYTPVVFDHDYMDRWRSAPSRFIDQVKELGVPFIKIPVSSNIPVLGVTRQIQKTARIFRENKIDLVHIHTSIPTGARSFTIGAWLSGIRAVVRTEHTAPSYTATSKTPLAVLPWDWINKYVMTVSDASLEEQVRLVQRDRKKLYRSYPGIELDRFHRDHDIREAKKLIGLNPDLPVIGSLGRLAPEKGHTYLLQAVPRIFQKYGPVNYLIIGDGPLEEQLKQQVAELGLSDYFHFTGFIPQPKSYIEAMDIGVMPSLSEGLPFVLLEFMALGVPTVTSSIPCFREAIIDGESGFITSIEEGNSFTDHIIDLLRDPVLAFKMGQAALERVSSQFSIQRLAHDMMDLYDRVFDSK